VLGFCECGWSERTLSRGSALGALAEHLAVAVPGEPTVMEYVDDQVHEKLAHALDTLGRMPATDQRDVVISEVKGALENYYARLTQG
jgi:hypothetical protein